MWMKLYVFSFAVGAVLLVASLLAGLGEDPHDAGSDALLGHGAPDAGGENALLNDAVGEDASAAGDSAGVASIFLSLRFWTFFTTFFGLTGALMHGLRLLPIPWWPFAVAVLGGAVSGGAALQALRFVGQQDVGRVPDVDDFVGKSARVLVAFGGGGVGKVRLQLRGTTVDMLATGDDPRPFVVGQQVLVIGLQDAVVTVVHE